jgi:hypothetical protein
MGAVNLHSEYPERQQLDSAEAWPALRRGPVGGSGMALMTHDPPAAAAQSHHGELAVQVQKNLRPETGAISL